MSDSANTLQEPPVKTDGSLLKLNVGAGSTVIDGYTPIDIKTGTDARKLPYENATVDEVYASHVLEHFPYEEVPLVLAEWARVLKPGGLIRIGVPDFDKIKDSWNELTAPTLQRYLLGGHIDKDDFHQAVFDQGLLSKHLARLGFVDIKDFEPFADDTTKHPISMNIEARKAPLFVRPENPTVALVLSQPRLSFSDHSECLIAMAMHMKMGYVKASGAFWDRDIENATNTAIATYNPDYLLYSDYDSVFTPDQVQKLIDVLQSDLSVGVVGSVQMSRHDDLPLVFEPGLDYSTTTTPVRFQHFGLTLIRRQVFEMLPKPWFWSVPGLLPDGSVGWDATGRSDADITFWRVVSEHGIKVVQRNDCVIGHMVLCVKWPRDTGSGVQLQPIEMWNKLGQPKNAVLNQELCRAAWLRKHAALPAPPPSTQTATEATNG